MGENFACGPVLFRDVNATSLLVLRMTRDDRTILAAGMALGVVLIGFSLADVLLQAFPARPASTNWRWGLLGYLAIRLPSAVLGWVVALTAATLVDVRGARLLARASSVFGLLLLAGLVLFVVDGLEIRSVSEPETMRVFINANARALPSLLLGGIALLWAGGPLRTGTREVR